jgi:hypothetical protein
LQNLLELLQPIRLNPLSNAHHFNAFFVARLHTEEILDCPRGKGAERGLIDRTDQQTLRDRLAICEGARALKTPIVRLPHFHPGSGP